MEVILLEDIENLGKAGQVVKAKDGYCRNYLLPRKKAALSTSGGLRFLDAKKKQAELRSEQLKKEAEVTAQKIAGLTCKLKARVGQEGKLFGSITTQDVHEFLEKSQIVIDRKRIEMAPVHELGEFQALVKLHPEVAAHLKVVVTA
ncbi:MAG: 50S ribosomal protein L9 [Candidatus Omnitrophica bacterium CG11_big_fil_rev_8_21_14_0_20_45_26]|uniref:Large ribosomal subunit protein bL9 n=1 Tax=Candidatus Abzuiibacterium crystallinum TaxID=1974748 RepID=A0A2H0LSG9_9BACT|nr:MAG: 50S ribosomal protein L9 [Candidatus Omnitrophica bacterium CG11_big_fil_rev_8_21_14_0_20_45_26]PIW63413.1 MAG: 50S ribosomal protein L9 [Candidatus Omnitrophica bacterium CG12_big_fil_rev_8_21_14_0_65_45_16]